MIDTSMNNRKTYSLALLGFAISVSLAPAITSSAQAAKADQESPTSPPKNKDGKALAVEAPAIKAVGTKAASQKAAVSQKANTPASSQGFPAFVQSLWPEAQRAGVSRATFDAAFQGVTPDPAILRLTKSQAEFSKPVWSYIDGAVSEARIRRGQAQATEWSQTVATVERRYGVDPKIVLGIWGLETNFGSNAGNIYVIRALATLAHARYRDDFFKDELIMALLILEQGHIERDAMRGSWAGAMGQTQFMPSSFMKYAVDFNGGGAKDIWSSTPDALASTANYLKQFGWKPGIPWGAEVTLPEGFDFKLAERKARRNFAAWAALGVRPSNGETGLRGEAGLFLPAGSQGPAFLVTDNFDVIKKYNNSDSYALGVALLGERIYGADPLQARWPRHIKALSRMEGIEVQKRLVALGYRIEKIDGKLGENSRDALRNFQLKHGVVADGYPTHAMLARLRSAQ